MSLVDDFFSFLSAPRQKVGNKRHALPPLRKRAELNFCTVVDKVVVLEKRRW